MHRIAADRTPLTEPQRKYLRRLGHDQQAIVMVGQAGLGPNLVAELDRALRDHEAAVERAGRMRRANPFVIPRNHRVEEALAAASNGGDLVPFERLLDALRRPFEAAGSQSPYAEPAPAAVTACYQTFCGT